MSFFSPRFTTRQMLWLTRQWATLEAAGIAPARYLEIMSSKKRSVRACMTRIRDDVLSGLTINDAIQRQNRRLGPLTCNVAAAGEKSGRLDLAFETLSHHFEEARRLQLALWQAAAYPLLLIVALVTVPPLMRYIVGQISLFTAIRPALHLAIEIAYICCIIAVLGHLGMLPRLSPVLDRLPLVGPIRVNAAWSRFFWTLAACLRAGLSWRVSLELASASSQIPALQLESKWAADALEAGVPMPEVLAGFPSLPDLAREAWRIGDESGRHEEQFEHLARSFANTSRYRARVAIVLLFPLFFLLAAGAYVGMIF